MDERGLIELWSRCSSPEEFEMKASISGRFSRISRFMFRLYAFRKSHPRTIKALARAGIFIYAISVATLSAIVGPNLAYIEICIIAVSLLLAAMAAVAGVEFDEFCERVIAAEEA